MFFFFIIFTNCRSSILVVREDLPGLGAFSEVPLLRNRCQISINEDFGTPSVSAIIVCLLSAKHIPITHFFTLLYSLRGEFLVAFQEGLGEFYLRRSQGGRKKILCGLSHFWYVHLFGISKMMEINYVVM